jgi:hypothetical protein
MIRRALVEDCDQLAELHTKAWKDAYKDILPKSFLDGLDISARKANWEKVVASVQVARASLTPSLVASSSIRKFSLDLTRRTLRPKGVSQSLGSPPSRNIAHDRQGPK